MRLETTLRKIDSQKESLQNLIDNTIRFQWSHADMIKFRVDILRSQPYKSLPRWAVSYLDGWFDAFLSQIWRREVVFSYETNANGDRHPIDSDEYRKISPYVISELYSKTGCYVWRADTSKRWTDPTDK